MDKTYTRSEVEKMLALFGGMIIAAAKISPEEGEKGPFEIQELTAGIQAAKVIAKKLYRIVGDDITMCYVSAGTYALMKGHMADALIEIDEKYGLKNLVDLEETARVIEEACKQV